MYEGGQIFQTKVTCKIFHIEIEKTRKGQRKVKVYRKSEVDCLILTNKEEEKDSLDEYSLNCIRRELKIKPKEQFEIVKLEKLNKVGL